MKQSTVDSRAGALLLIVGLAALTGAGVLLFRALDEGLHPHLATVVEARAASSIRAADMRLTPGLRAQAVIDISGRDAADRPSALTYRVTDAAGRELARDRIGGDALAGDASSLSMRFRKLRPPADGRVTIEVEVHGPPARPLASQALRLSVFHELKDYTVIVILAAFMGVGGVAAATVGGVQLLTRAPRLPRVPAQTAEIRRAAMLCHLAALAGFVLPLGNVVAPFVMWVAGRDLDPFVDQAGREALNFQLSILFYALLGFALTLALVGLVMLPVLLVVHVCLTITAARRVAAGVAYRYPLTFRLV